jgi:cobalt-precorrin-5B (C1)-methyltransferase
MTTSFGQPASPAAAPGPRRLVGGKLLRRGYTTGTCAAAAAKAAAVMLLTGRTVDEVDIGTPGGLAWRLDVLDARLADGEASCAVRKFAGDDPDATDGALVYAAVRRGPAGIAIDGGEGVGRVTKAGLDQPVGAAAINSTPRRMIAEAVREAGAAAGDEGGWQVVVSCPAGRGLAAKTFNPRLGVVGGISILGTTGLVEPMSHAALVETMARQIAVLAAAGLKDLLVVVGNYGESFARDRLGLAAGADGTAPTGPYGLVKSSNFIGDALDQAVEAGVERLLLVGHIGKLVKFGIGLTNTHSSVGDGRLETLVACALEAGAEAGLLRRLLDAASTDAALDRLAEAGLLAGAMAVLAGRIQATLDRHVPAGTVIEWLCFRRTAGVFSEVARSAGATALIERWRQP